MGCGFEGLLHNYLPNVQRVTLCPGVCFSVGIDLETGDLVLDAGEIGSSFSAGFGYSDEQLCERGNSAVSGSVPVAPGVAVYGSGRSSIDEVGAALSVGTPTVGTSATVFSTC